MPLPETLFARIDPASIQIALSALVSEGDTTTNVRYASNNDPVSAS